MIEKIAASHSLGSGAGVTRLDETGDLWWKNAVIYCVDPKTFLDFDGDGYGDLAGLTHRLDYLSGLGVTCLWLMPFYPSPGRDDGYDVSDYYGVDPRLGSLGDFARFVRTARDRGMRVIIDLVVNHTSDRHPWFRSARSSKGSQFRDWYIWSDESTEGEDIVFPGEEESAWAFDVEAGQHYLHHFRTSQPDLNLAKPEVRDEIVKVMDFWLSLGVSGFRVDAVPFLLREREDVLELVRAMRSFMSRRFGEGVLLGENNLPPAEQLELFGGYGEALNMQFNFILNQAMCLAFARQDPGPVEQALDFLPPIPADAAWANWVRNHDELSLDKLSPEEREEVFAALCPGPEVKIYNRGLRCRLPSMVKGDPRRIRLAYSLMFSLPGTPVLLYGEEIGMSENLGAEGRLAVRPPMQWSGEEHAGFSPPGEKELVRPLCSDYHEVNVADQRRDPESLLNWMERLIRRRRECPAIGWGLPSRLDSDAGVLAHRCDWRGATFIATHNFTERPLSARLVVDDLEPGDELLDLLGEADAQQAEGHEIVVELPPYGYRWLRRRRSGERILP